MGSYIYSALYNTRHCPQAQPRCYSEFAALCQATLPPGPFGVFQVKVRNFCVMLKFRKPQGKYGDILVLSSIPKRLACE
jgi:hypothetical protein